MKKNNKGFLLAESLVVSTFVLTILILLFIQFSNLTTNYKNSYNYNNVESIYDLASVADYIKDSNYALSSQITASKPYVVVYRNNSCNMDAGIVDNFCDNLVRKMDAKMIIYTSSDVTVIQDYISKNEDTTLNQKFRDFISKVETNKVQNKGRLFAEFNNGTYATVAMDNVEPIEVPEISNIIQVWTSTSTNDFHTEQYKSSIVSATFVDNRTVPSNATESWDVSAAHDGGVMAWVIPNSGDNTKYDLYIGADGGVVANKLSSELFYNFTALKTVTFGTNFDTSNVQNMYAMFKNCNNLSTADVNNFNTSSVKNMADLFYGCNNLIALNINNWNVEHVENITQIFAYCNKLTKIDLNNWNTSNITVMTNAFWYCHSLNQININNWDTSKVTNMNGMFSRCNSLISLDISKWDTRKVTNMNYMFYGDSKLTSIYVGPNWTTANATTVSMFNNCGTSSVTKS